MCHGTDTQRECEQGQCYAEEMQAREAEREHDARVAEEADMERRYREDPPQ